MDFDKLPTLKEGAEKTYKWKKADRKVVVSETTNKLLKTNKSKVA